MTEINWWYHTTLYSHPLSALTRPTVQLQIYPTGATDNVCPECEQSPSLQLPGEANGPDPEGPQGPTQRSGAVPGRLIDSCGWWRCEEGYNNNRYVQFDRLNPTAWKLLQISWRYLYR